MIFRVYQNFSRLYRQVIVLVLTAFRSPPSVDNTDPRNGSSSGSWLVRGAGQQYDTCVLPLSSPFCEQKRAKAWWWEQNMLHVRQRQLPLDDTQYPRWAETVISCFYQQSSVVTATNFRISTALAERWLCAAAIWRLAVVASEFLQCRRSPFALTLWKQSKEKWIIVVQISFPLSSLLLGEATFSAPAPGDEGKTHTRNT